YRLKGLTSCERVDISWHTADLAPGDPVDFPTPTVHPVRPAIAVRQGGCRGQRERPAGPEYRPTYAEARVRRDAQADGDAREGGRRRVRVRERGAHDEARPHRAA